MTHEEVLAQMTGPDGPFELVVENVRGLPTKNFAARERSLREKVETVANYDGSPSRISSSESVRA